MTLPDPVQYAIPFFVLAVLAEMVLGRLTQRARYEARDTAASLSMGLGNVALGLLTAGFIHGAYTAAYSVRLLDLGFHPLAFVACFFAEDLAYYWFHRCSHERRWLWAAHVVHHSSQHYNLSTALRQPWTSFIAGTFVFWLPLPLIGFPPAMVLFFQGISLVYQFWIHTEAIGRMGPLEWVLNTPSHHRVHHAINPHYIDKNYAGILIIWDRLFGTFTPEAGQQGVDPAIRYGIVKPIATFNPLRIALHLWAEIGRDLTRSRSVLAAWRSLVRPP